MATENPFSISLQKITTFNRCLREYFLRYLSGQRSVFPAKRKNRLLSYNLALWRGKKIHEGVASALSSIEEGEPKSLDEIVQETKEAMEKDYRALKDPPRSAYAALRQTEGGFSLSEDDLNESYSFAELCLSNFFRSYIYTEIRELDPEKILSIEGSEDIRGNKYQEFDFKNARVQVRLDLAYINRKGEGVIVDWKTGKTKQKFSNLSLPIYALYVKYGLKLEMDVIRCIEYYLQDGTYAPPKDLGRAQLLETEKALQAHIRSMLGYLRGVPKNLLKISDFPKTGYPQVCTGCQYRNQCD